MDLLSQHEAFLRAIFDTPDDDTPRLVYADFLEEHGDEDRAAYIRYACELARLEPGDPRRQEIDTAAAELIRKRRYPHAAPPNGNVIQNVIPADWPWADNQTVRGFPLPPDAIPLYGSYQEDEDGLRWKAVSWTPEWYGASAVKFFPCDTHVGAEQVDIFLGLPFTQQVTQWDFGGSVEEAAGTPTETGGGPYPLIDFNVYTVITTPGVEVLSRNRAARRITSLDLRNNNLDNDAARALVRSPYLDNLKRLQLLEGNRLRGRVWQQVIERFGEDVVG